MLCSASSDVVIAGSEQDLVRMAEDRTLGNTIVENQVISFGVKYYVCPHKGVGSGFLLFFINK
jgi:hypothetical protein